MAARRLRGKYLLDAELEAFVAAVRARTHRNSVRDRALFAILVNTGIRPSEALAITRADVCIGRRESTLRVRRLKLRIDAPADVLVLTPLLADAIAARLREIDDAPDCRLFDMCQRQARRLFGYYMHKAGLSCRTRLYILRHTAATRMYRSTRNIALVQAMLGHKSPDTTAIYAQIPRSVLQEAANLCQGA